MTTEQHTGRLGRRFVGHDPGNRAYGIRPRLAERAVERRPTFWPMPAGAFPLDQQREGGCEAWGMAHELAAGPIQVPGMSNAWAHAYYGRVQATDRALGNDFGGDGATTLANMKTAKAERLITGYRWAFGLDDVVDTLCSVGPVCLGVEWREGMYETGRGGEVRLDGDVVGGHFITALGYDVHPQWGPCVLWLNSWGAAYGVAERRLNVRAGVGWIRLDDLGALLSRDGEAVVPADFLAQAAPVAPVAAPFFASSRSSVFHRERALPCLGRRDRGFATYGAAVAAGLRPCRICRPKQ